MKRKFKIGLTAGLSIVTIWLLVLTIYRWMWDYNENGNHFDQESMTNYSDNAITAYGTLTIIFLIPTLILLNSLRSAPNRQQSL